MDEIGFRKFLKEGKRVPKGLGERTIRSNIRMVKEFEGFLKKSTKKKEFSDAKDRDVKAFVKRLAKEDRANFDNLIGLLRYARFSGNQDAALAFLAVLETDLLPKLCTSFMKDYGKSKHNKILGGFALPPIGTSPKLIPKATAEFMKRLESGVGEKETRDFLAKNCPDAGPPEYYSEERTVFLASKDIDDYLRKRRRAFVEELEGHMKNGTPFYTQMIDKKVIDFVKSDPEIGVGARRGDLIYHKKIPYMTIEYLREKDPKLRRYYACHCPLARESILTGKKMSSNLCYCSAGYTKRPFEAAFAKTLKAEVTKSVLWGDDVCQFAIEIPERLQRHS